MQPERMKSAWQTGKLAIKLELRTRFVRRVVLKKAYLRKKNHIWEFKYDIIGYKDRTK